MSRGKNGKRPDGQAPLARLDPDKTLKENALDAWEQAQLDHRNQMAAACYQQARRILGLDNIDLTFDERLGGNVPSFEVDDEIISFNGREFLLVEFCSVCGENANGRPFTEIAILGRHLEAIGRDDVDAHVCGDCKQKAAVEETVS